MAAIMMCMITSINVLIETLKLKTASIPLLFSEFSLRVFSNICFSIL